MVVQSSVAKVERNPVRAVRAGTLRAGRGEPLLLFHGVTGSAQMWTRVLPHLSSRFDVIAPTALGHRFGPPAHVRPAKIAHVVDDAERFLDQLGIEAAHLAGNSMGGWVALELARRGRARSVCALSPAGMWGDGDQEHAVKRLRSIVAQTRFGRLFLPLLARWGRFRRWALRDTIAHGERATAAELVDLADALLACSVRDDLFATTESLAALTATCPITIAWSAEDRIFPVAIYRERARVLVSGARFTVLDGVGHVPMLEAPELVAQTILQAAALASANYSQPTPS